jgi:hypothetical protein
MRNVVMVSDRRATAFDTGEVKTDAENKAVVINGHLTLGYSGLTDLDGRPTDEWVVEVLSTMDPSAKLSAYLSMLAGRATAAIRRSGLKRKNQRHAFLIAGWVNDQTGKLVPIAIEIGNFRYDATGRATPAADTFSVVRHELDSALPKVYSVGTRLRGDRIVFLERVIRRYEKKPMSTPLGIAELLAREVRLVARPIGRKESSVGSDVMLVSLPRAAVPAAVSLQLSRDGWRHTLTAGYLGKNMLVQQFLPAIVTPQVSYKNIAISFDPSDYPLGPLHRRPL